MKIEVVNLGEGLKRLDIIPTFGEPTRVPTFVADDIMRDVVRREKGSTSVARPCNCGWTSTPTWNSPTTPTPTPSVESGFDAHIDRPQRQNYGGVPFYAERAYREDMAKYKAALNAVKKCDWPCKEDLKGVPSAISQHNPYPQTKCVGVPVARPITAPRATNKGDIRAALDIIARALLD